MTSPTHEHPDFLLNRPAALIAALPAMLGFVPERSLVVVTLEKGLIGAVLRRDLRGFDDRVLTAIGDLIVDSGADAAIAVAVGGPDNAAQLISDLSEYLYCQDISLVAGHVVDRVARDGTWYCYDGCGAGGPVDDPTCSPLAVAAVLAGRQVRGSREELARLVSPVDPQRTAALARTLRRPRTAPTGANVDTRDRRDIRRLMGMAARLGGGEPLTDRDLVAVARALGSIRVRDTVYALAVGALAEPAEALWMAASRALPAPWRAETLVLLGYSAYARGDGPLAGVALDAALDADPTHRMGRMLCMALQTGLKPADIRALADTGFQLARELNVMLPRKELQRAG